MERPNASASFSKQTPSGAPPRAPGVPASPTTADSPAAAALSAERRRNKLGYHRTSVACGHCRRRKIRCMVSPSDTRGRCVNCIRLKKECSFCPVQHASKSAQRNQGHPKASAASSASSASASSSPSTVHLSDSSDVRGACFVSGGSPPTHAGRRIPRATEEGSTATGGTTSPADSLPATEANHAPWADYLNEYAMAQNLADPAFVSHMAAPPVSWNAAGVAADGEMVDDVAWSSYPPPANYNATSFGIDPVRWPRGYMGNLQGIPGNDECDTVLASCVAPGDPWRGRPADQSLAPAGESVQPRTYTAIMEQACCSYLPAEDGSSDGWYGGVGGGASLVPCGVASPHERGVVVASPGNPAGVFNQAV